MLFFLTPPPPCKLMDWRWEFFILGGTHIAEYLVHIYFVKIIATMDWSCRFHAHKEMVPNKKKRMSGPTGATIFFIINMAVGC